MKTILAVFGLTIALLATSSLGPSMANESKTPLPISKEASKQPPKKEDAYWTEDQIKSAKPLELPTPKNDEKIEKPDENSSGSVSGAGSSGE